MSLPPMKLIDLKMFQGVV